MFSRSIVVWSATPEGVNPLYFWNAITACCVTQPYCPPVSGTQKPRSSSRCCRADTAAPLDEVPTATSGAASGAATSSTGPVWAVVGCGGGSVGGGAGAGAAGAAVVG